MVSKWMKQLALPGALVAIGGLANVAQAQVRVIGIEAEAAEEKAAPGEELIKARVRKVVEAAATEAKQAVVAAQAAVAEGDVVTTGKFWLGFACEPVSDVVKAQLALKQGLVVQDVIEDGPAAKAKLAPFDVLLTFNGEALDNNQQLMQLVETTKGGPATITLLRGGKEQTLTITPAERPTATITAKAFRLSSLEKADRESVERIEAELKKRLPYDLHDVEMMIVRPGVAFPADRVKPLDWPKDASILIHKDGDKPAEITIKRGDKAWKVSEDKLGELPPEVRELVERMRGGAMHIRMDKMPGGEATNTIRLYSTAPGEGRIAVRAVPADPAHPVPPLPPMPATIAVPATPGAPRMVMTAPMMQPGLEKQLGELNRKLDQLLSDKHGDAVKKLEAEVDRLRQDLESLRKESK